MTSNEFGAVVESIDRRLAKVEQILPTLATKAEMEAATAKAIEPLATRAEMDAAIAKAIAPLATKAEMEAAIAKAIEPLATRAEMRAEIREEGERTRRHFAVVAEGLGESLKSIADGHAALTQQLSDMKAAHDGDIARLDARVTRLEARPDPSSPSRSSDSRQRGGRT
ncbi:MAG: hypothetical protein AB7I50_14665 [Vicinamibacterales bacterium]